MYAVQTQADEPSAVKHVAASISQGGPGAKVTVLHRPPRSAVLFLDLTFGSGPTRQGQGAGERRADGPVASQRAGEVAGSATVNPDPARFI